MTKDEVLTHAGELAEAVDIPVSADLENCFSDDPDGVAATITAAIEVGLAGLHMDDQGMVKIHSVYVRYLLPMTIEFQYWEFPEAAQSN